MWSNPFRLNWKWRSDIGNGRCDLHRECAKFAHFDSMNTGFMIFMGLVHNFFLKFFTTGSQHFWKQYNFSNFLILFWGKSTHAIFIKVLFNFFELLSITHQWVIAYQYDAYILNPWSTSNFFIMTKYRKVPVEILILPVPAGQPRFCTFLDVKRRAESDGTGFINLPGTWAT